MPDTEIINQLPNTQTGRTYLVDVENVGSRWLNILPNLESIDHMLLFYTDSSMKFTFDLLRDIGRYINQLSFIKCFNGQANSLDFQLSASLGYLSGQFPETEYIIISNDTDYDNTIKFMHGLSINVSRMTVSDGVSVPKNKDIQIKHPDGLHVITRADIVNALNIPDNDPKISWIFKQLRQLATNKTMNKAKKQVELNNQLQKVYHDDSHDIYVKLRKAGILQKL